ncbi:complement receptor type 2-like isoform X2 [Betta splendens]|uniref:Complement receptor type 2-like isoform X2 n=1 Tax=Betta splendens TaxID=158456 RepID=A0A6P7N5C3_BETSP|nr:complement receptor type 2-like isoform X2 [Betta splendens]
MGVVHFLLLSGVGFAMNVQAQNCSTPQPGPNMHIRGDDILLEMFPDGTKVYFACAVGYQSAGGSTLITCNAGNWSPVRLRCERKSCGSVGEVPHGQIHYQNGAEFGDKVIITCDLGYILVGRGDMTCEDQGWSGRLPVCEEVMCDPPPPVVDGTFSPENEVYSYRDVVRYRCKKDYTLIGPKSRTCSEDGTFKPEAPTCALIECEEPNVVNADWSRNPPYRPGAAVTLYCRPGYALQGEQTQLCGMNGQWSPGLSTCEPKSCSRPVPQPNVILKGNSTLLQTFPHGTTVSFACDVGYKAAGGSDVITCSLGVWSSVGLKCQRKNCGTAGEVTHGQVVYPEGTEFGHKAKITCNTGYKLVGKDEIICEDQGWSSRLSICEVVTCDPPPQIVDGTFSPENEVYSYRDVVRYRCKDGYTTLGSKSRTCSADGTFTPDAPTCALIECEEPPVANADWIKNPPYKPGSAVKFQCRSGYTLQGEQTQTCDISGQWSPKLPTCEQNRHTLHLILCFLAGLLVGILVTLLVKLVMERKRSRKNVHNQNETKQSSELQALSVSHKSF